MRWVVGSSTHGCWLGWYDRPFQERFKELITPGDVVLDLGAHVGFFTLLASRLVGPSGHVYAFEPLPTNLPLLRRHLSLNNIRNVDVLEAAVGSKSGQARFGTGPDRSQGALRENGDIPVQVVTLDELRHGRRIPSPQLIKIDVEGAEGEVLAGAQQLLRTDRPALLIALHSDEARSRCVTQLRDAGYGIEAIAHDEILALPPQRRGPAPS